MCQLPFLYVIITIFILKYWLYTNSYFFLPVDVSNLIQLMIFQLQWILHDWNDEDSVTILKRCKEAILKNGKGKVIIIEIVIGSQIKTKELTEVQLCNDLIMMATFSSRERSLKEWEKLFFAAGFSHYQINTKLGARSLIELYP